MNRNAKFENTPEVTHARLLFGTPLWLEMVGEEMKRGIVRTPQARDYSISFVERYHGAPIRDDGTTLGFRVDIHAGALMFRAGVTSTEVADVVIDADVEVIKRLTVLKTDDPHFQALVAKSISEGSMKVTGDRAIGTWSNGVHDAVCDRTAFDAAS
jgi:hypothetical protein